MFFKHLSDNFAKDWPFLLFIEYFKHWSLVQFKRKSTSRIIVLINIIYSCIHYQQGHISVKVRLTTFFNYFDESVKSIEIFSKFVSNER